MNDIKSDDRLKAWSLFIVQPIRHREGAYLLAPVKRDKILDDYVAFFQGILETSSYTVLPYISDCAKAATVLKDCRY